VIKVGLQGIPPFAGVGLRFTLAGIVLLLLFRPLGGRFENSARERWMWMVNALLPFSLSYGIVYWTEQWLTSGLTSILFATLPLLMAPMAHLWLPDERLTARSLIGVLIGFSGVVLIFSEDLVALAGARADRAALVMLFSPLAVAIGNVIVKRWGAGLHPLSLTAVPMLLTGVLMGVVAATFESTPMRFDAVSLGALFYLALVGTALTFSLYFWLLERVPATQLSLIAYIAPVIAVGVGALFLDEQLTARTLGGAALVVVGVALGTARGAARRAEGVGSRRGRPA
jgi:drug/metabolite transporter (DMT)-like permease